MRVLVIGGGTSSEHAVSLASADAVAAALAQRHDVVCCTIARDGTWWFDGAPLPKHRIAAVLLDADVVFPALHGVGGEDGAIQGLLTTLGIPFVGCGVEASAVCMRKDLTKAVLAAHGIATVEGAVVRSRREAEAAVARLGTPVVVKPLADGSSTGVLVARDAAAVAEAARAAPVLVERFASGMEVDVAVVQLRDGSTMLGAPLEIARTPGGVFDGAQKYGGAPPFILPARLTAAQRERLEDASVRAFTALGCSGLARIDWFVDGDDLRCNEVNTMPGMTRASQLPRMLDAVGMPFDLLVHELVVGASGADRAGG